MPARLKESRNWEDLFLAKHPGKGEEDQREAFAELMADKQNSALSVVAVVVVVVWCQREVRKADAA
eukprot:4678340-Amphidinium_carterae.1